MEQVATEYIQWSCKTNFYVMTYSVTRRLTISSDVEPFKTLHLPIHKRSHQTQFLDVLQMARKKQKSGHQATPLKRQDWSEWRGKRIFTEWETTAV